MDAGGASGHRIGEQGPTLDPPTTWQGRLRIDEHRDRTAKAKVSTIRRVGHSKLTSSVVFLISSTASPSLLPTRYARTHSRARAKRFDPSLATWGSSDQRQQERLWIQKPPARTLRPDRRFRHSFSSALTPLMLSCADHQILDTAPAVGYRERRSLGSAGSYAVHLNHPHYLPPRERAS